MKKIWIIYLTVLLTFSSLCFLPLLDPVFAQPGDMGGVYSLGNFFSQAEIVNSTGLSLRVPWKSIESQKGNYNWKSLDININKAITNGKKIMIRVIAGEYTPDWVYNAGAEAFTYMEDGQLKSMPLPWDAVYLKHWAQFIQKLGSRYGNMPQLVTVHITGPSKGGEMHLPDKENQVRWLASGYTKDKLIWAWETVIDAYNKAFPLTPLGINIATPVSFDGSMEVVEDVLDYAYAQLGYRLRVQGNWLSAKTSNEFLLYQIVKYYSNLTNVGFQMLCSADMYRFGGTLLEGINKALDAGASYLEIYGVDVENPAYEQDIKYADYYLKLNEK